MEPPASPDRANAIKLIIEIILNIRDDKQKRRWSRKRDGEQQTSSTMTAEAHLILIVEK